MRSRTTAAIASRGSSSSVPRRGRRRSCSRRAQLGPRGPRARSRPGPRRLMQARTPHSAATASKSRPTRRAHGASSVRASRAIVSQRSAVTCSASARGSGGAPSPATGLGSHAQASRHGSRTAWSPPGSAHRAQMADAVEVAQATDEQLAAPDGAVAAVAASVEDRRRRLSRAHRARRGRRRGARGDAGRRASHAVALERVPGRQVVGMEVVCDDRGLDRKSLSKCAIPSVKERSVSWFFRSPMWWPTHARSPLATQNVLFSSAPQASSGRPRGTGSSMVAGTWPLDRRSSSARPPTS